MALLTPKIQSPVYALQAKEDMLIQTGDWILFNSENMRHFTAAEYEALAWLFEPIIGPNKEVGDTPPPTPPPPPPEPAVVLTVVEPPREVPKKQATVEGRHVNGATKDYSLKQRIGKNPSTMLKVQSGRFFYALRSLHKPAKISEVAEIIHPNDQAKNISPAFCQMRDAGFVKAEPRSDAGMGYLWSVTDEGCRIFDEQVAERGGPACFLDYNMAVPPDHMPLSPEALAEAWRAHHNP
jgi:hypothetical protein